MADLSLYSLTLLPPGSILASVVGNFAGLKSQELVLARGSNLEIYRPSVSEGTLGPPLLVHPTFSIIRDIQAFRIAGSSRDLLLITSDAGRLSILAYDPSLNSLNPAQIETFGKTGIRRVVPGQYMALDPKGRAVMLASLEKNKLVYILNRDDKARVTISSPLEAHKPHTLCYSLVGVDVGYENPIFAALEVDYNGGGDKKLTFYELDLGLNHVIQRSTVIVDQEANFLIHVPGGNDGPSGVIVAATNYLTYYTLDPKVSPLRLPLPRRQYENSSDIDSLPVIVTGVVHKIRGQFFILLQSNLGDLYKVTFELNGISIDDIKIKYFDTIPVSKSLNVFKSGFLFSASEAGDPGYYQFEKLADDDDEREISHRAYEVNPELVEATARFRIKSLDNLVKVDSLNSLNPCMSGIVANLKNDDDPTPQIYTVSGQRNQSRLQCREFGRRVTEIVSSELPGSPQFVWTTRLTSRDEFDAYIVLSFLNATLVLSIGETVEEVTDSGLLGDVCTLLIQQVGLDSLIQVHSGGLRHISLDKTLTTWTPPSDSGEVVLATANNSQVCLVLGSNQIVYFEIDEFGQLNEYQDRLELNGRPTAIALGEVAPGKIRSNFLAVGLQDSTVRIFSLDPDSTLENLAVQALSAPCHDIKTIIMADNTLYLHMGLTNGTYIKTVVDSLTGELSGAVVRFLGPVPVRLAKVFINQEPAILALGSKVWAGYIFNDIFQLIPLSYVPLGFVSSFKSPGCLEGLVGIESNHLRIFTLDSTNLYDKFTISEIALKFTPRRVVDGGKFLYIVGADKNTQYIESTDLYRMVTIPGTWSSAVQVVNTQTMQISEEDVLENNEAAFGITKCQFKSTNSNEEYLIVATSVSQEYLPRKSCTKVSLRTYIITDHGSSLQFVHSTTLDREFQEAPTSLIAFQGKLLVGLGSVLRVYDMGSKQLLRKAEIDLASYSVTQVSSMDTQGNRIVIGDLRQGCYLLVYKSADNIFIPFCDDFVARPITLVKFLDYDTVMATDRWGNFFTLRCPKDVSEASDEDKYGIHIKAKPKILYGTMSKFTLVNHQFLGGDLATSLHKTNLLTGTDVEETNNYECVLWTGLQGTLGLMIPILTRSDQEFFAALQAIVLSYLDQIAKQCVITNNQDDMPQLQNDFSETVAGSPMPFTGSDLKLLGQGTGRDHLKYRSYYSPVRSTVDGDVCELYLKFSRKIKSQIAKELGRTYWDIEKKIMDIRSRVAY
ncbi:putative splicing factor 3B subunit 3 [Nadsonia fulvescens var. elongata DSM 6958]|uniref:Putative splicing factor 3B subunit 3 n=1 Tax=Nadsonia fulvescens var. elongata DSM 6958 TaxID=857566 RepID=A0A1E3PTE6_9ASCO|nr:putative splicing factor 3B subunit 3 [Nadsonia fulvescens var. elongata DSM 6958]